MLIKSLASITLLFLLVITPASKKYHKVYDTQGTLKAEGWMMDDMRVKYWKIYHPTGAVASKGHYKQNSKDGYWYYYNTDGNVIQEGHYAEGIAQKWWIFYDLATREKRKVQYENGKRNGFCLVYKNGSLEQVEKYDANQKVGTWKDVRSFKRDNPDVSF